MKEFIEKLIERLEEEKEAYLDTTYYAYGVGSAIKIVNQLAEEYKPKTQADKIRAMNDEELAEFLYGLDHYWDDGQCILRINDNHLNDYKDDILDWLQSEAETKGE